MVVFVVSPSSMPGCGEGFCTPHSWECGLFANKLYWALVQDVLVQGLRDLCAIGINARRGPSVIVLCFFHSGFHPELTEQRPAGRPVTHRVSFVLPWEVKLPWKVSTVRVNRIAKSNHSSHGVALSVGGQIIVRTFLWDQRSVFRKPCSSWLHLVLRQSSEAMPLCMSTLAPCCSSCSLT